MFKTCLQNNFMHVYIIVEFDAHTKFQKFHTIATKTKLTLNFMKRKMKEYDELKREVKD